MANSKVKELDNDIKAYNIKRKKIVPYVGAISIFVLNHRNEKSSAEEIENDLKDRGIIIKRDISEFSSYYDKEINVFKEVTYMVVLVSKELICDWALMEILLNNYRTSGENKRIIPLIVEDTLYKPIEKSRILQILKDDIKQYDEECFDRDYNGEVAEELRKMQKILEMIKSFLTFSLNRDRRSNSTLSQRIIKYIKHDKGIDVNERGNEMLENGNISLTVNGGQLTVANGNATINVVQNNGVSTNELDNIIKGIMSNLAGLKEEDASNIADVIEMARDELEKPEPKVSRLKNCLTLIAPMFTIANGLPTLMDNLQKLQEFIRMHIH